MAAVSLRLRRLLILVAVTFMLLATTAAPALAQNVHVNAHVNVINNNVEVSGNTITVNVNK